MADQETNLTTFSRDLIVVLADDTPQSISFAQNLLSKRKWQDDSVILIDFTELLTMQHVAIEYFRDVFYKFNLDLDDDIYVYQLKNDTGIVLLRFILCQ